MKNACMYKAWTSWHDIFAELGRQRSLLEKMALRMRSAGLYKCWAGWQAKWRYAKTMRHSAEKVVGRWQNMLLVPAFLALKESAKVLKKMRSAGGKVVLRWHRLQMSNGFYGWMECAATRRRMAVSANKIVLKWRHLAISAALSRWTEYVFDKKRMVQSAEKVVSRMQKMELWSAFATLKEATAVAASERREYATNKALRQCKNQNMGHDADSWIGGVFRFVFLCAFVLLILALDSVAYSSLQSFFAEETTATRFFFTGLLGHVKSSVVLSKPLVSGKDPKAFIEKLGMRAEQSPDTEQMELRKGKQRQSILNENEMPDALKDVIGETQHLRKQPAVDAKVVILANIRQMSLCQ
jgi:hypothetical protein